MKKLFLGLVLTAGCGSASLSNCREKAIANLQEHLDKDPMVQLGARQVLVKDCVRAHGVAGYICVVLKRDKSVIGPRVAPIVEGKPAKEDEDGEAEVKTMIGTIPSPEGCRDYK